MFQYAFPALLLASPLLAQSIPLFGLSSVVTGPGGLSPSVMGQAGFGAVLATKADSPPLDAEIAWAVAAEATRQGVNDDASSQHSTPTGSTMATTLQDEAHLPCVQVDLFGADPTGTNYSDAAYSAAMALATLHHGCVQFGGGLYKFSAQTPWTFPTTGTSRALVHGIGADATALYWPNSNGGLLFAEHSDHHSFEVVGLTLLTGQAGLTEAIAATNDFTIPGSGSCPGTPYHSEIRDVSIQGYDRFARTGTTDFWKTGVHTTNVSFLDWDGLNVTDADPVVFVNPTETGIGMLLEGTPPGLAYPSGCLAVVFNGSRSGYWNLGSGIKIGTWAQGFQLDKLNFTLGQFGINQDTTAANNDELSIENSQFNTARYQMNLQAGVMRLGMHNNTVFLPNYANGLYSGGGHSASITGNHFVGILFGSGERATTATAGVHLIANDSSNAAIVTGNTFVDLAYGVALEAGTSGVNVQSNAYTNVTSHVSNNGTSNTVGGGSQ